MTRPLRLLEIGLVAGEIGGASAATTAQHEMLGNVMETTLLVARATPPWHPLEPSVRGQHVGFALNTVIDHWLRRCTKPQSPFLWGRSALFTGRMQRAIDECDVLQVYTSDRLLGASGLRQIVDSGKPTVLFPMDFELLTGGCHYPHEGCEQFKESCGTCPISESAILRRRAAKTRAHKAAVLGAPNVRVIAGNAWFRDRVIDAGCSADRVRVIYPPLDDVFHTTPRVSGFRDRLGIHPTSRVLTVAATSLDAPRKRIAEALEIARITLTADETAHLVVVGARCPPVPPEIDGRTHLVGVVEPAELAKILADTDVFISTASEDAGPMMVAAALACGASVAATPIGYGSDLLTGDYCGDVFTINPLGPGGTVARAQTVRRILDRRSSDLKAAQAACKELGKLFAKDSAVSAFLEVYDELLRLPRET